MPYNDCTPVTGTTTTKVTYTRDLKVGDKVRISTGTIGAEVFLEVTDIRIGDYERRAITFAGFGAGLYDDYKGWHVLYVKPEVKPYPAGTVIEADNGQTIYVRESDGWRAARLGGGSSWDSSWTDKQFHEAIEMGYYQMKVVYSPKQ